jgi:ribose/xylose/arabinose/galactoside ABC-type transport system permease subunit
MLAGGMLALLGFILWLLGQTTGLPRLPGDFVWRRGNVTVYFPLATSVILSILLTVLLNWLLRQR